MKATNIQVGGSHYIDMAMQPIELISALKCSFIQGCIIKYISRYKAKNGAQDIRKCIHYAQLAIHLKDSMQHNDGDIYIYANNFADKNNLTSLQRRIINYTLYNSYEKVIYLCNILLRIEYPKE